MVLKRIPEACADFQRVVDLATEQGDMELARAAQKRHLISCRLS